MITSITISNSSGISEEVTIDFNKGKYDFKNHFIYKDKLVSPAVLYGNNGSGKTSVLRTFNNLIQIFSGDLQQGAYYAMPNIFTNSDLTSIKLELLLNESKYIYKVNIQDKDAIVLEELIKDDNSILKRTAINVEFNPKLEARLENNHDLINAYTNPLNSNSKLSILRELGRDNIDEDIVLVYKYFRNMRFVATNKAISSIVPQGTKADLLVKFNDQYELYTKNYPSIMNLKFREEKGFGEPRIIALYEHKGEIFEFDYMTMISSGTRDYYETLAMILSLEPGSALIVDELEKTFHPELLDNLIYDIVTKLDIQLICSSHNTHLLQSLRPDQIYFVTKDGLKSKVNRLSKEHSGIREIHNIEKLYFGGRIG